LCGDLKLIEGLILVKFYDIFFYIT